MYGADNRMALCPHVTEADDKTYFLFSVFRSL